MRLIPLIFLLVTFVVEAADVPSISVLNLKIADDQKLPLSNKVQFIIKSSNTEAIFDFLKTRNNIKAKTLSNSSLWISLDTTKELLGESNSNYLKSSFVIDYDEPEVQAFVNDFKLKYQGQIWGIDDLLEYVDDYIDNPSFSRGFDLASIVVKKRSGDCTEYSVLTTALARALGMPSRVMVGAIIIDEGDKVSAIGHAWSEIWQEGKWKIADSAMFKGEYENLFYLPSSELMKEDLGYTLSIFKIVGLMPKEIIDLKDLK